MYEEKIKLVKDSEDFTIRQMKFYKNNLTLTKKK